MFEKLKITSDIKIMLNLYRFCIMQTLHVSVNAPQNYREVLWSTPGEISIFVAADLNCNTRTALKTPYLFSVLANCTGVSVSDETVFLAVRAYQLSSCLFSAFQGLHYTEGSCSDISICRRVPHISGAI